MDALLNSPADKVAELRRLVASQQAQIVDQQQTIQRQKTTIESLEEALIRLRHQHFGRRSEKMSADQIPLQFFNEAELVDAESPTSEPDEPEIKVAAHTRKAKRSHALPADLPRVEVVYDLPDEQKNCPCCGDLHLIGEERLEQLAVVPKQFYVIVHVRKKYASSCKSVVSTATMPKQPLPASQASPTMLAHVMVSKFHDGLPLYRQEQIAAREGLELPREKLARWLIRSAELFQPVINLLQDAFVDYDIAHADETGIQVLKESGRKAENKSYLWIRRGGLPEQPVVLVDYSPSRSGETAQGLLEGFNGYLICDGYSGYNPSIKAQGLKPVYCNDHARRKFVDIIKSLKKEATQTDRIKEWIASQAVDRYKKLYEIERQIKALTPEQKYRARQARAVPLWKAFIQWATKMRDEGVAHEGTHNALEYFLNHAEGLRRYCDDGRLPISNIRAEHTAKKIAVARKAFLFADTPAGAKASAQIYSLLESARANGQHVHRYLTVLLTELPNATCVEDIEALLPWNLSAAEVERRFAGYPTI